MFVDTNVLVYASSPGAPNRERARAALERCTAAGERLCISRQILREFLAVVTRPQVWARAKAPGEAAVIVAKLAEEFDLLEEGVRVWEHLIGLCRKFDFGGRQVHDANIVATMLAHSQRRLLTFNAADFRRFADVVDIEDLAKP